MKIEISSNGRHFTSDSKPFFFLADTAWNTALRADVDEWIEYLDLRAKQGFTVIQFVTSPWRACKNPIHGRLFEGNGADLRFDEHAFEKMDDWFELVVDRGMVPAPVMLWDLNPKDDYFLRDDETCIAVARKMIDRWSKFEPIWILAGDGDYRSAAELERWKRIGRGAFGETTDQIVTMHPCGLSWVGDLFADEPWYSFVGIQSGHGSVDFDLGFLLHGPYTRRWREIQKPFVNLEPNYERSRSYRDNLTFTDYHVRRANWWSLLGAPVAGVTYGNENIWSWAQTDGEPAEGHPGIVVAGTWRDGLDSPGAQQLGAMRSILEECRWTELRPALHLLSGQPGWSDPNQFVSCATNEDHDFILAYLPAGGTVAFNGELDRNAKSVEWIEPATGRRNQATDGLTAPDDRDWLLAIER